MDSSFILNEFALLEMRLQDIGPFRGSAETLEFKDRSERSEGEPANYCLMFSDNGRGKTNILETMVALMGLLGQDQNKPLPQFGLEAVDHGRGRAQLDLRISYNLYGKAYNAVLSLLASGSDDASFLKVWDGGALADVKVDKWHRLGVRRNHRGEYAWEGLHGDEWLQDFMFWINDLQQADTGSFANPTLSAPTVIYFPAYRNIARLNANELRKVEAPQDWNYRPVHVFRGDGRLWSESLDNLLVWLLWLDQERYDAAIELLNETVFDGGEKELKGIVRRSELAARVKTESGELHRLDQLSSGEKSLVQIFLLLGTHMTSNTIVLIDEVDAHLHPEWRYKTVDRLKDMLLRFPGMSVLLTTHSEEVIRSLKLKSSPPGIRPTYTHLQTEAEREKARRIRAEALAERERREKLEGGQE